jgi:hypothetical protein
MHDGQAPVTYLIGTDEAGYGPNLGPLVISAAVWQVPSGVRTEELYDRLEGTVTADCRRRVQGRATLKVAPQGSGFRVQGSGCKAATIGRGNDVAASHAVAVADSKKLYQSGKGLARLERGVLALLGAIGRRPTTWRDVWTALAPDAHDQLPSIPWYADYDEPVPLEAGTDRRLAAADHDRATLSVARGLAVAGVRLVALQSRAIFAGRFNELLERHPSKGAALSHETLGLLAEVVQPLGEGSIHVVCDKHGGRNSYRDLLEEAFPGSLIEIGGEGPKQSLYRFGPPQRRVEVRFEPKAEQHLPTALASMVSKYLRELAMRAFNRFWRRHVPGLAPTAGYPLDARRFKTAIAAAQAQLGISDRLLWRNK